MGRTTNLAPKGAEVNLPSKIISTGVMTLTIGLGITCSAPATEEQAPVQSSYNTTKTSLVQK